MSPPHLKFSQLSIASIMQTSPSSHREQSRGDRNSQTQSTPTSIHNSVEPPSNTSPDQQEDEELEDEEDEEETDESESEDEGDGNTPSSSPKLFALDHCRQIEQTFAFQIAFAQVERYSVRFNAEKNSGRPTCSCGEEGTCQHIAWLLEQLEPGIDQGIDQSLSTQEQLHETGLDNICHTLDWELRESPLAAENEYQLVKKNDTNSSSSDSVVHPPSRVTRGMRGQRLAAIRDIMATLSHHEVQDTYRPDIFDDNGRGVSDYSVAPQDLEKTLARIIFHNDRIFRQFDSFVPDNVRAEEYFQKMVYKAQSYCDILGHYAIHGPDSTGKTHDVIWCGNALAEAVESIHKNIGARGQLSSDSREVAAKALIDILKIVISKNTEVYPQVMNWPRRRPHGELQIDRNLYMRLIGKESPHNPAQGTFVLKALQELPEAVRFVEDLEEILVLLTNEYAYKAPTAYTNKLREIIARLKGTNSPGESSSGKRPASSMDRRAKRMK